MILCKLTVWLISILFSIAFHWLVTLFGIVKYVIIGQPKLHLPENRISKLIIIRIICEFWLMCAVHTLPYLSHKMVKIMFLLEYLLKFSCTNYINNVWVIIMVCYSSCQPFPSIYNLTICIRIIFTRFEAQKYILFEW